MDHRLLDLNLSSGGSSTDCEHQHDPAAWITNISMASSNARTRDINMASDSSTEQGYQLGLQPHPEPKSSTWLYVAAGIRDINTKFIKPSVLNFPASKIKATIIYKLNRE